MVINVNVIHAKNIYYDSLLKSRSDLVDTVFSLNEREKKDVFDNFNKIKSVKVLEGGELYEKKYLPLDVYLSGSVKSENEIEINVKITNPTSEKWFFPSPTKYFGNRFISIRTKNNFFNFPGKIIEHRPITNDSTMNIINPHDVINLIYSIDIKKYCTKNGNFEIYVNNEFLPEFISKQQENLVSAQMISKNKLFYNCETKNMNSLDNNFDPRKLSHK